MISINEIKTYGANEFEWEDLIRLYNDGLIKYCYSILCNYADAEDAVQTTFIKAITNSNSIKNKEAIKSYLYKVAYRASLDIIRKRKASLYSDPSEYENGYTEENDMDFPHELKDALAKLSPLDRALFYERAVNDVSYRELSEIYSKSQSSLRKKYERARKKVAKHLKKCNAESVDFGNEVNRNG